MQAPDDVISDLSEVIRGERDALGALARREGLGHEDAVDCVQDAFCTFLERAIRGDLPEKSARGAFLAGIVKNTAKNKQRRHHVARPHVPLDDNAAHRDDATAEEALARAEDHIRLRACMGKLCDTQRAVVTLRMLEERDGEDVAVALGVTRNYVDVLLHRARSSLMSCMME